MENEQVFELKSEVKLEQKPTAKPEISPVDAALRAVSDAEKYNAQDSMRRIIDGAIGGTCIVFIATMLGVPKIDRPLNIALYAFVIALPPLAYAFLNIYKDHPDAPRPFIIVAMHRGATVIEALGQIIFLVGLSCILLHFSLSLFLSFIITLAIVMSLSFLSMMPSFIIRGRQEYKNIKNAKTENQVP